YTPGHAPHQISMMLDKSKALLTADAVGIVYPGMKALIPTTPPPSFDPKQLVATVASLKQTTPSELLVPHFGVRKDVEWVLDQTAQLVERWVEIVRVLWKKGISLDEASEIMEKEILEGAGVQELPIYASISIRTSVMGIIHYLEKSS
ncbi:MAG: hypothetical protein OK436_03095, partial [Thaumarchaeota archaeon]|nr:hypothetical protein [Nitrososphaerota archaeon]